MIPGRNSGADVGGGFRRLVGGGGKGVSWFWESSRGKVGGEFVLRGAVINQSKGGGPRDDFCHHSWVLKLWN